MTAKWGKRSLWCFALSTVGSALLAIVTILLQGPPDAYCSVCEGPCMDSIWFDPVFIWVLSVILLSPLNVVGLVLAFLGIRKKETLEIPQLGLALNSIFLLVPFVFAVRCIVI